MQRIRLDSFHDKSVSRSTSSIVLPSICLRIHQRCSEKLHKSGSQNPDRKPKLKSLGASLRSDFYSSQIREIHHSDCHQFTLRESSECVHQWSVSNGSDRHHEWYIRPFTGNVVFQETGRLRKTAVFWKNGKKRKVWIQEGLFTTNSVVCLRIHSFPMPKPKQSRYLDCPLLKVWPVAKPLTKFQTFFALPPQHLLQ